MNYSKRILETVRLMQPGNKLADIGCDHGYMCICAIEKKRFLTAVACDVRPGPLSRAKENIAAAGLTGRITAILSDGFGSLKPDFDCAVICGMGGLLIQRILAEGLPVWSGTNQLILGPHSEVPELRSWILTKSPFTIRRESVLKDAGKFYVLLDLCPKEQMDPLVTVSSQSGERLRFGNPELQENLPEYRDYLKNMLVKTETAILLASDSQSERSLLKLQELERDRKAIQMLLS